MQRACNGGVVKPTKIVQNLKGVCMCVCMCVYTRAVAMCVYVIEPVLSIEVVTLHCVSEQVHGHTSSL